MDSVCLSLSLSVSLSILPPICIYIYNVYADTLSCAFMMYDVSGILQQLEGGPTKSGLGATTSAWTQLLQAAGHGMVPGDLAKG